MQSGFSGSPHGGVSLEQLEPLHCSVEQVPVDHRTIE